MTTTRKPAAKPAARKTTARRTRKPPVAKPPKVVAKLTPAPAELQQVETPAFHTTEQKQAKFDAYHALKAANIAIPAELEHEVRFWAKEAQESLDAERQAQEQQAQAHAQEVAEANAKGPWYVRNGTRTEFNLRLDRQTEKRRIQLKPRGAPGDLHPLKDEDLKDPVLRANLQLGVIEVIPAGEAEIVISKQMTNAAPRVHSPLAVLRNELGQQYPQGAVKVEAEFNSQGVTVAQLDPRIAQGQIHDRDLKASGGLHRSNGEIPQQAQGPQQAHSVVQSGFVPTGGAPASIQYGGMDANAQAKAVDDLARRKDIHGPAAGLGGVSVVVEPVKRT